MKQAADCHPLIKNVVVEDIFEEKGKRSLTLKVIFQSEERELSSKDVGPARERVLKVIKSSGGDPRT